MNKLIFDRTQQDIINLTSKAYYNYDDLNRIEEWCEYLAVILNGYDYIVDITIKKDWKVVDFPTAIEMERIRSNVEKLKQAYISFTNVPSNLDYMTYQKANDIERILHEMDKLIKHMENYFICSGVARCGQNRIWQQRFRRKYIYLILYRWIDLQYTYWNEMNENTTWEEIGKHENSKL